MSPSIAASVRFCSWLLIASGFILLHSNRVEAFSLHSSNRQNLVHFHPRSSPSSSYSSSVFFSSSSSVRSRGSSGWYQQKYKDSGRAPLRATTINSSTTKASTSASAADSEREFWTAQEDVVYSELGLKDRLDWLEERQERQQQQQQQQQQQKLARTRTASPSQQYKGENGVYDRYEEQGTEEGMVFDDDIPPKGPSSSSSSPSSQQQQRKFMPRSTNKLPLPFLGVSSIGAAGRWVERGGNFVLTPSNCKEVRPLGVIHFLGGAFVGAAPHLTYRYLLESLAEDGYIIVATPYRLDMDYLRSCDEILQKFENVAIELAAEFGALPVIGLGHSCGALLETLISSLFPDTPRAVNILISFNNKPASSAIPGFNELIAPLSERVMGSSEDGKTVRGAFSFFRKSLDNVVNFYADSPLTPKFLQQELVPIFNQGLEIVDQIPDLLKVIADGEREFSPSPADTKEAVRRMYRARRTLLIQFENDDLDESEEIEKVLREANTIMRMKRPMVEMDVSLRTLSGSHITPLTQNPVLDVPALLSALTTTTATAAASPSQSIGMKNVAQRVENPANRENSFSDLVSNPGNSPNTGNTGNSGNYQDFGTRTPARNSVIGKENEQENRKEEDESVLERQRRALQAELFTQLWPSFLPRPPRQGQSNVIPPVQGRGIEAGSGKLSLVPERLSGSFIRTVNEVRDEIRGFLSESVGRA